MSERRISRDNRRSKGVERHFDIGKLRIIAVFIYSGILRVTALKRCLGLLKTTKEEKTIFYTICCRGRHADLPLHT